MAGEHVGGDHPLLAVRSFHDPAVRRGDNAAFEGLNRLTVARGPRSHETGLAPTIAARCVQYVDRKMSSRTDQLGRYPSVTSQSPAAACIVFPESDVHVHGR